MISQSHINRLTCGQPAQCCLTAWSPPETLRQLANEEIDLVGELIQSFTADVGSRLQQIRGAVTRADVVVLRSQIHAVKGSSKQMAAGAVASLCEQIEAACRERPISQLAGLVSQLEVSVAEVFEAMAWYQRSHDHVAT